MNINECIYFHLKFRSAGCQKHGPKSFFKEASEISQEIKGTLGCIKPNCKPTNLCIKLIFEKSLIFKNYHTYM